MFYPYAKDRSQPKMSDIQYIPMHTSYFEVCQYVSPVNQWLFGTEPNCSYAGLRKVRDDQKTHKNKELRKTGPVPDRPKPAPGGTPKPGAAPTKKPPVFELQGKKWIVVRT